MEQTPTQQEKEQGKKARVYRHVHYEDGKQSLTTTVAVENDNDERKRSSDDDESVGDIDEKSEEEIDNRILDALQSSVESNVWFDDRLQIAFLGIVLVIALSVSAYVWHSEGGTHNHNYGVTLSIVGVWGFLTFSWLFWGTRSSSSSSILAAMHDGDNKHASPSPSPSPPPPPPID